MTGLILESRKTWKGHGKSHGIWGTQKGTNLVGKEVFEHMETAKKSVFKPFIDFVVSQIWTILLVVAGCNTISLRDIKIGGGA